MLQTEVTSKSGYTQLLTLGYPCLSCEDLEYAINHFGQPTYLHLMCV